MKLFSVSAIWHVKGCHKDTIQTSIIMAETREEARAIFEEVVKYPENSRIDINEWGRSYTLSPRRMI